jgi:type IV pilus assembly protein PilE
MRRESRGFTLIEMLVVVAVIAILAAIAYPSYLKQLQKGNRGAAEALMLDLANKQQLYLASQRQYASGGTAVTDLGSAVPNDVARYYTITITADNAATPVTFTVTATPTGNQTDDGVLVVDSVGNKTRNGDPTQW